MIPLIFDPEIGVWCEDLDSFERLIKNCIGVKKDKKIFLDPEEALYVLAMLNGEVYKGGQKIGFNELASFFLKTEKRLIIKYNCHRDWRDRGLILKRPEYVNEKGKVKEQRKYPSKKLEKEKISAEAYWYPGSFFSVIENEEAGKKLFENYWFGQFGIYKQDRGGLLKLDFLETVFLSKHFGLKVIDASTGKKISPDKILEQVTSEREYTKQLYDVYEDWRLLGFVVKTGFKFGSHFRIYFPGAAPNKSGKWIHSKHVLHVFPKEQKLLISEWARAVRVAHGVKKTFLLGIPEMEEKDFVDYPADFLAYRRKKVGNNWIRETTEDKPRFLLMAVSEDEHIGGIELASMLNKAKNLGVELILSISDRETAITYYILKKIRMPGSRYEYYEIEWEKP